MATFPTNPELPQGTEDTALNPTNWNTLIDNINAMGEHLAEKIFFYASSSGATGDGSTPDQAAVQAAFDAATVSGGPVYFAPGTYKLSGNVTANSDVTVVMAQGAKFSVDNGITLTINGWIAAGAHQIFDGAGSVVIGTMQDIILEWWGTNAAAWESATNIATREGGRLLVYTESITLANTVTIALNDGLEIYGRGRGMYQGLPTTITWDGADDGTMFLLDRCNGFRMSGFRINGAGKAGVGIHQTGTGGVVASAVECGLSEIWFLNFNRIASSVALKLGASASGFGPQVSENTYDRIYFADCSDGVWIGNTNSTNFEFKRCNFNACTNGINMVADGACHLLMIRCNYGNNDNDILYNKSAVTAYTPTITEIECYEETNSDDHIDAAGGAETDLIWNATGGSAGVLVDVISGGSVATLNGVFLKGGMPDIPRVLANTCRFSNVHGDLISHWVPGREYHLNSCTSITGEDVNRRYGDMQIEGEVLVRGQATFTPFAGFGRLENLLKYSEQFNNAAWSNGNGATVTADDTTAPDGTATADKINIPSNNGRQTQVRVDDPDGKTYTFSIWVKSVSGDLDGEVRIAFEVDGGEIEGTYAVGVTDSAWRQHSFTRAFTASPVTNWGVRVGVETAGNHIYVWGAQLEEVSVTGPYVKTVADYFTATYGTGMSDPVWLRDTLTVGGVATILGIGDGGLTNYDLKVGDTDTPDYGMIQIGNALVGRTSYSVGNIDLDGAIIIRNIGGPVTSEIEFVFCESNGNTARFALPKSGVGNATYNPRSMLIAGPAPADTDMVKVTYWRANNNIFHNIDCDTSGVGADLGVQNDLEVENDIFTDSIKESTTGAGVSIGDGGATNYMEVKADGEVILHGTARVKNHAKLYASAGKKAGVQDPTSAVIGITPVEQFSQAVTQHLYYTFHTPEDWDPTTDMLAHVHWAPVNANAGDVVWDIDYTSVASNSDEVLTVAPTSLSVTDSTEARQDEPLETTNVTMVSGNLALEDIISIHVSRDTGDGADTYAAAASFIKLEIAYTKNKHGETT